MNQPLAAVEAAYIAAFVDGEGTITIARCRRVRNGYLWMYRVEVSFVNTHLGVLSWIKELVGGGTLTTRKPPKAWHKTCYCLRLATNNAITLIKQIKPYLRIKAQQAEIALEYGRVGKHNIGGTERERREKLRQRMVPLNQRGTA